MERTTASARTRKAISNFKKWEQEPKGEYIPKRGEFFVPMSTEDGKGIGKWWVSNKGTIISFINSEESQLIKQTRTEKGYMKSTIDFCNGWVHRIVWFSFRDCLKFQRYNYEKIKEVKEFLTEGLKNKEIEVHHIDTIGDNNNIDNLQGYPEKKNDIAVHSLIHISDNRGLNATDEQIAEIFDKLNKLDIKEPTMIYAKEVFRLSDDDIHKIKMKKAREGIEKKYNINNISDSAVYKMEKLLIFFETYDINPMYIIDDLLKGFQISNNKDFETALDTIINLLKK